MGAYDPAGVHRAYEHGVNTGDLEAVLALYEPDAVVMADPGSPVSGTDAIRRTLSELFAIDGEMHIETVTVVENGDTALLRSSWEVEGVAADGTHVSLRSQGAEVVRRAEDGTWRFVIDNPWAFQPTAVV